jgi:hypothetical protein
MQYVNLLGALGDGLDLDSFVTAFSAAIGGSSFSERESGNYVGGRYYKGVDGGLTFTISLSDEEDHTDLPYWIQIAADVSTSEALVGAVDRIVREKALPAGFRFARMVNLGKRDERRIDY